MLNEFNSASYSLQRIYIQQHAQQHVITRFKNLSAEEDS